MTDFKTLVASLDPEIRLTGERSFELILDEGRIACRTMLTPDDRWIVADFYLRDVSELSDDGRRTLNQAILSVNGIAPFAADYSVGIDTRGFLVLTGRRRFAGLTGDMLATAIGHWLEIGRDVGQLASAATGRVRGVTLVELAPEQPLREGDSA